MAFARGDEAWRPSVVVRLIRIAAKLNQRADARLVAVRSGDEAWVCAITFRSMRIDTRCGELLHNVPHHVDSPCSDCSEQQPRIIGIFNNIVRLVVPGGTSRRVYLVEIYRPGWTLVETAESID